MTFLEICQRLRSEAGISGSGPTTVVSQTGEIGRVVEWALSAYEDIQNKHTTWEFLQEDFTFSTVDGTQSYAPADVDLDDLGSWKTGDADLTIYSSVADEQYLIYCMWENFKINYMFGSTRTQEGRPTIVTIKPDNAMLLWTIPDAVYTVTGEYYKKAQTMALDADEPIIPSQFQMIIVWRGLMFYGAYSGDSSAYTHGEREYKNLLRKLEKEQLAAFNWGAPLA